MAGFEWEQEYERQQSRLRDGAPRCTARTPDGHRCRCAGRYRYRGYFPDLGRGVMCPVHHVEADAREGLACG